MVDWQTGEWNWVPETSKSRKYRWPRGSRKPGERMKQGIWRTMEGRMEGRGGKEKKRKTTREEDRRWQRLPWPGPHRSTWPGPHSSSIEPNYEATSPQRFSGNPNNQSSSMEPNHQCPPSSSTGENDQGGGGRKANHWKLPRCHLVAAILIALLSTLIRPTVGGEDL